MPKAYLVAHIRIHDTEKFEEFKAMSGPVIQAYGGRVLVRNPAPDHREGDLRGLVIMVEFSTMDQARAFYDSPDYTAAKAVRELAADTDLMLIEGL